MKHVCSWLNEHDIFRYPTSYNNRQKNKIICLHLCTLGISFYLSDFSYLKIHLTHEIAAIS